MLKDGDASKLRSETPELKTDEQGLIPSASENDPLIGTVIAERLEILAPLGAGGMSTVYKAKHLLLNRIVAVKVMRADKTNENVVVRFQQEAKAATALNHPNIAAVREFGLTQDGDPYLVMDYVDGISLADLIEESGALVVDRTRNVISQICAGLQHAHSLGVVHRDLKPANIMLSTDSDGKETARIVDFGIAKMLQKDEQLEVTRAGEIFGTPLYMSPEQGLGKNVDARSDIYSLGCVMYECLSGKPPFVCSTALETLMQHASESPVPLKHCGPFGKVVLTCLEKQPENRYQSADELRQAILDPTSKHRIPNKAVQSSYVWKNLIFGIICLIAGVGLVLSMVVWPYLRPLIAPAQWEKLAADANTNKNLGPNNYEVAASLFRRAAAEAEQEHVPEVKKELLYRDMGRLYDAKEDYKNAIAYFHKALAANALHEENRETGSLNDWLGEAYARAGDYKQAVKYGELGVSIKKRILGEHEHTLFALLHLGQAYRRAHMLPDAEKINRESVAMAQKFYPKEDNPNLSDAYLQLAHVLSDEGKRDEAIEQYKNALKSSLSSRGTESALSKKCRDELVRELHSAGRNDEADKVPPLS